MDKAHLTWSPPLVILTNFEPISVFPRETSRTEFPKNRNLFTIHILFLIVHYILSCAIKAFYSYIRNHVCVHFLYLKLLGSLTRAVQLLICVSTNSEKFKEKV